LLAPESLLLPLGLSYQAFGLVRSTVLGLMQAPAAEGGRRGATIPFPRGRTVTRRRQEPPE
jgi:hypothetical protein